MPSIKPSLLLAASLSTLTFCTNIASAATETQSIGARLSQVRDQLKAGKYSVARHVLAPIASRGHAESQTLLALMYEKGLGGERNFQLAAELYAKAAAQHVQFAQNELARMYLTNKLSIAKNPKAALAAITQASKNDVAEAENYLGQRFLKGNGVPKSVRQGLVYLHRAAEQGESEAQNTLISLQNELPGVNTYSQVGHGTSWNGVSAIENSWQGFGDAVNSLNTTANGFNISNN